MQESSTLLISGNGLASFCSQQHCGRQSESSSAWTPEACCERTFFRCGRLPDRPMPCSARPARSPDHSAEIAALEAGVLVGEDVGLDVAERRVGLALDAIVEGLDDVFLEMRGARIGRGHGLALRIRALVIGDTEP